MKTTVGNIFINEQLPDDLKDHSRQLDKKKVSGLIAEVGKKHPQSYGNIVKGIKDLGDYHSTLLGSSFSIDDFKPKDLSHIHKKYQPHIDKANQIENKIQKHNELRRINIDMENEINAEVEKDMKDPKGNRFLLWGKTGAKGSVANFRQMLYASGNQVDVKEELFPHMSRHSFAEGLDPSDFFITSIGARKGVVGSFMSVRDPGAFSKELLSAVNDLVVTSHDCGTTEGKSYDTHHPDTLDRVLLKDHGTHKAGEVVTHMMQDDLKKQGFNEIHVRTPLHCHAVEGVCAKCYGPKEDGHFAPVGDPIGIRSSQALSEPLTQMALGSKHGGGVLTKKKPAFQKLRQLLHAPENFPDAAVLSRHEGSVNRIEPESDGGTSIYVEGVRHYATPNTPVKVKVGDKVTKGDMLADGLVNPKELVDHKGVHAGRAYLADMMRNTYIENGYHGHPKIFETLTRGVINHGLVEDPGDHDLLPEQVVRWNQSQHKTKPMEDVLHPHDAIGWRMKRDLNGLAKDTLITPENIHKVQNFPKIEVYKKPAVIKPYMLSTERAALHKDDFVSAMGYRNIKQVLEGAVSEMSSTPLHSYNPITSYVHGAEFGQGEDGKF